MREGNFEARNGMRIKFQGEKKGEKSKVLLMEKLNAEIADLEMQKKRKGLSKGEKSRLSGILRKKQEEASILEKENNSNEKKGEIETEEETDEKIIPDTEENLSQKKEILDNSEEEKQETVENTEGADNSGSADAEQLPDKKENWRVLVLGSEAKLKPGEVLMKDQEIKEWQGRTKQEQIKKPGEEAKELKQKPKEKSLLKNQLTDKSISQAKETAEKAKDTSDFKKTYAGNLERAEDSGIDYSKVNKPGFKKPEDTQKYFTDEYGKELEKRKLAETVAPIKKEVKKTISAELQEKPKEKGFFKKTLDKLLAQKNFGDPIMRFLLSEESKEEKNKKAKIVNGNEQISEKDFEDFIINIGDTAQEFREGHIGGEEVMWLAKDIKYWGDGLLKDSAEFSKKAGAEIRKTFKNNPDLLAKMLEAMVKFGVKNKIDSKEIAELACYLAMRPDPSEIKGLSDETQQWLRDNLGKKEENTAKKEAETDEYRLSGKDAKYIDKFFNDFENDKKIGGKEILEFAKQIKNGQAEDHDKFLSKALDKIFEYDQNLRGKMADLMIHYARAIKMSPEEAYDYTKCLTFELTGVSVENHEWITGEKINLVVDGQEMKKGMALYNVDPKELENIKLFTQEMGEGRWNTALVAIIELAKEDFPVIPNFSEINAYDRTVESDGKKNIFKIKMHTETKEINMTVSIDEERKNITISDVTEAEKEKTEPEIIKEKQASKVEQWHDEISAIFTENEANFIKTASAENLAEEIEKLEVLLRPDPNKEKNKLAEPYHAALIFVLDDFDRSSKKFKGKLDMNSLKEMLNIHNKKAEAFFSALFEKLEEFAKKSEDIKKSSSDTELKENAELDIKSEAEKFLKAGIEEEQKSVDRYEEKQEENRNLPYSQQNHEDIGDAVMGKTWAYTGLLRFTEALEEFKKGNYELTIEVLKKFKTKKEKETGELRGSYNHSLWRNEGTEEDKEKYQKRISELDVVLKNFEAERVRLAEKLAELPKQFNKDKNVVGSEKLKNDNELEAGNPEKPEKNNYSEAEKEKIALNLATLNLAILNKRKYINTEILEEFWHLADKSVKEKDLDVAEQLIELTNDLMRTINISKIFEEIKDNGAENVSPKNKKELLDFIDKKEKLLIDYNLIGLPDETAKFRNAVNSVLETENIKKMLA